MSARPRELSLSRLLGLEADEDEWTGGRTRKGKRGREGPERGIEGKKEMDRFRKGEGRVGRETEGARGYTVKSEGRKRNRDIGKGTE